MSAKINIVALAAIFSRLAAPVFAGDQDLATELRESGPYFGIRYTANPQHLSAWMRRRGRTPSCITGLRPDGSR